MRRGGDVKYTPYLREQDLNLTAFSRLLSIHLEVKGDGGGRGIRLCINRWCNHNGGRGNRRHQQTEESGGWGGVKKGRQKKNYRGESDLGENRLVTRNKFQHKNQKYTSTKTVKRRRGLVVSKT